jgi:hypothetical protein
MCVIIQLLPDQEINQDWLYNSLCNNWHSYGILTKDPKATKKKRFELFQGVPDNANLPETDEKAGSCHVFFDDIQRILKDTKKIERFIHFRHATKGTVDLENCHPLLAYEDEDRQTYLFHNGTLGLGLGEYVNRQNYHGHWHPQSRSVDDNPVVFESKMSDTKEFVEKHLKEPLGHFAKGDYNDPMFKKYIWDALWTKYGGGSKILMVANDLEPLRVGPWVPITNEDNSPAFYASNNDYFKEITRGPLHQGRLREARRLEEQKRAEERAAGSSSSEVVKKEVSNGVTMTPYTHGIFQPDPEIVKGVHNLLLRFGNDLSSNDLSTLNHCTIAEFEGIVESILKEADGQKILAGFFEYVTQQFMASVDAFEKLENKHRKASQLIEQLTLKGGRNVG